MQLDIDIKLFRHTCNIWNRFKSQSLLIIIKKSMNFI